MIIGLGNTLPTLDRKQSDRHALRVVSKWLHEQAESPSTDDLVDAAEKIEALLEDRRARARRGSH